MIGISISNSLRGYSAGGDAAPTEPDLPDSIIVEDGSGGDADPIVTATNGNSYSGVGHRRNSGNVKPITSNGDNVSWVDSGANLTTGGGDGYGLFYIDATFLSADTLARTSNGFIFKVADATHYLLNLIANDAGNSLGQEKLFTRYGSYDGTPNSTGGAIHTELITAGQTLTFRFYIFDQGVVVYLNGNYIFSWYMATADQATYRALPTVGYRADVGAVTDNSTSAWDNVVCQRLLKYPGHFGARKKVIIDTDFSSDLEDLFSVYKLIRLAQVVTSSPLDVIGIVCNTSNTKAPGAIAATLKFLGKTGVRLGTWKGAAFDPGTSQSKAWVDEIYDNFPRDPDGVTVGLASTVDDAADVYHDLLTANADVEIISIGFLNNLSKLLDDEPALVAAKVSKLWIMGGNYKYENRLDPEYNFQQAAAEASNVAANWPNAIKYVGFEVGGTYKVAVGINTELSAGHLLYEAADANDTATGQTSLSTGREGWDSTTALAAAMDHYEFHQVAGSNSINSGTGVNTFTPATAGKDAFLFKECVDTKYAAAIDQLLFSDRTVPPATWTP